MVIIALGEQIRFAKRHIPHRIAILLAPFYRSEDTPPASPIGEAVLHGSFAAFRSLMDFMGLKDNRKSPFPSLTTHRPTDDDDVTLASFGLPPIKVEDLTGSDAHLLASVYRVANKAVAHLTSGSGHPEIDLRQYHAACTRLHALLRERLLSRY
jgi:hypothetical protein